MLSEHIKKQKFVDLAWPRRDKKSDLPNLQEELMMMEAWSLLEKDKEDLLPLPISPLTVKL